MPIDPSIPLSARRPQIDLMGNYSRLLGVQQQQEASRALAEQRQAVAEGRRLQTETAQRGQLTKQAAAEAIAQIRGGNAEAVLSTLDPEARMVAEEWLSAREQGRLTRSKLTEDARKRTAKLIRSMGYDPVVMDVALELHGEDDPEASEFFKTLKGDPAKLRQVVDAYATMDEKQGEGYTLNPGDVRYGPNNQQIAANPKPVEAPKAPTVGTFEDYVVRFAQQMGKPPEQLTPVDIEKARKQFQQADDRPRVTVNTTPSGMTPSMEANVVNRMVNQWTQASASTKELDRQVSLMRTGLDAARRGDMAQGAQAVLVTFQKILDPTSVVRESEYMRSAAGLDLMTRMEGALERLAKGGAGVPMADLERFAKLAEEAAKAQKTALPAIKERIGRQADYFKIPRMLVFEDVAPVDPKEPKADAVTSSGEWVDIGGGVRVRKK